MRPSFSLRDAISIAVLERLYAKAVDRASRAEERANELAAHNAELIKQNREMWNQLNAERNFWRSMELTPAREFDTLQRESEPCGKVSFI